MSDSWTLMSSHGVVLFYIAAHPDTTMREMAALLGLTERRVAQIVRDLADADYLTINRTGRRNTYAVNPEASFRHPTLRHVTLGQFGKLLAEESKASSKSKRLRLDSPEAEPPVPKARERQSR